MKTSIDPTLHWTDHYAQYGFAVVKSLVAPAFLAEALDEVKRLVGNGLPLDQWTNQNVSPDFRIQCDATTPIFSRIYDQPQLRRAIDEMFGSPDQFDNVRNFLLFVKPYDPQAKRELRPRGHIDFVDMPIPVLGSGCMFQVSLVDKEPFGGNITVWPGTHKLVQRCAMNDPDWRFPQNWVDLPASEPFEFVPQAGDVLFFHHFIEHEGNPCCTRMPRVSLHCQVGRHQWLHAVDPAVPSLSPWERSLAQNGRYQTRCDEKQMMTEYWATKGAQKKLEKEADYARGTTRY